MPLHFSQYGYTMTLHSLYDLLYSSMDIGFLFDLVDSLTHELEVYLDPHQCYTERCLEISEGSQDSLVNHQASDI